jgi:4-amino-4-deoxy-L-arabinose transferase-like glycosyltransferase
MFDRPIHAMHGSGGMLTGTPRRAHLGRLAARAARFRRWADTPKGGVILLIVTTFFARLLFAASLGLGMDESYMVASGRALHLSYFDHPPLGWWMAWGGTHLLGTDAAWAVRLPFVLTFAGTTWLMFALTRRLFNACAGLWAAALLNAAPVLGVTTGAWVLPDGPLMPSLLGAALCLANAVLPRPGALDADRPDAGASAWAWWLGAGVCAGLAMLSKYSAVLSIAGAALFLFTAPVARRWLVRPHPYVAAALALAVFSPVLVWNAQHGWISLLFQGGRAGIGRLHPFGPLSVLGGEAVFLLPWIWLPLVVAGVLAARRGPRDAVGWLLLCLALPPIVTFSVVALWTHVLFHWAAPGYLMLFPLLGDIVGRYRRRSRPIRIWLIANAVCVTLGVVFVGTEVRFNWLPEVLEDFALGTDPDLAAVDWTSVADDMRARGMLDQPGLVVAATRWFDAGKIDYALGGQVPVTCLGPDPREYGLTEATSRIVGHDVLLVTPRMTQEQIEGVIGPVFDYIEPLPPIVLRHAGRPAMVIPVYLGHHLHASPVNRQRT